MTHLHDQSRDSGKSSRTENTIRQRTTYTVEMTARGLFILLFIGFVAVIEGLDTLEKFPEGTPTAEECMNPPMKKFGHECCRLPKPRIWGDLRGSFHMCLKKFKDTSKQDPQMMRQEEGEGEPEIAIPPDPTTELPTESASTPAMGPPSTPRVLSRRRRPHWKKPLSERVKDYFASLYKEIKGTIDALWQSVIMITDHLRQHPNDSEFLDCEMASPRQEMYRKTTYFRFMSPFAASALHKGWNLLPLWHPIPASVACFMECVFEDQGFLLNKMVNKEALLTRLSLTLSRNEPWHVAAVAAVETCYLGLQVPANGTCQSGSEEIFRCIFKQLFFNCPNWTQNDYCTSLKEFYQKCPNGPPPEAPETDTHTTVIPEEESFGAIPTESQPEQ